MKLGELIDTLYATRQQRLEQTKIVDELKVQETKLREDILAALDGEGMAKASGTHATCGVKTSIEPVPNDWDLIHDFIRRENRFDLVQKRLSAPAWRGLLEAGITVPGTEQIMVRDLSLTKSTR
jgi:hypothetical protein